MAEPTIEDKYRAALSSSTKAVLRRSLCIMYAGSGVGKTIAAMTISEQCPKLPAETFTIIRDTIHVGFDRSAADSLPGVGLEVEHYIDFNELMALCAENPVTAFNELVKIIEFKIKTYGCKHVIGDTFSALVGKLVYYYQNTKASDFKTQKGEFDGNAFYRQILVTATYMFERLLKLQANVVFLSHTKLDGTVVATGTAKTRAELEAQAGGLSMQGKIEIDVVGQTAKKLVNEASIVMPLDYNATEKGVSERWFVIQDWDQTFQVKNRFAPFLNKKEPPNLRALFEKIRAGIAAKTATAVTT